MRIPKRSSTSLEDRFTQAIKEAAEQAEQDGVSSEDIDEAIKKAMPEALDAAASHVVKAILKSRRTFRQNRKLERGFDRRLLKKMGNRSRSVYDYEFVLPRSR